MPPDHPSARQGLGPALAELNSLALPACSLEFSSSPGQKGAEQTTPPKPNPDTHRVLLLMFFHLLFVHTKSALHTPRLSGQLRALTLWCHVPQPGALLRHWGPVRCQEGNCPVLALPNPHPPILWWVRRLGVSRGRGEFTHGRTQGCCPHGAPLEQCR